MTRPVKTPRSHAVSDSPWFWLCLFGTVGVVMLVSFSPKLRLRQAQHARKFEARQAAGQTVSPPADSSQSTVGLQPILVVLAAIVICSWFALWWQRPRWNKPSPAAEENQTGNLDHDVAT